MARATAASLFARFAPRGDTPRPEPGDEPVIRDARAGDLRALARIAAEREGCPEEESLASFERVLARSGAGDGVRLLVAELDGHVRAFGKAAFFVRPLHAPPLVAPEGWYLTGLVVEPAFRRRGIGDALTRERLAWIAGRGPAAYYFANARNEATIALHRRHGFVEITRSFHFPGVDFQGGTGILFRVELPPAIAGGAA